MSDAPNPFEHTLQNILDDIDPFVDGFINSLTSEFLILPKGNGFLEFREFDLAYEALKNYTRGFTDLGDPTSMTDFILQTPLTFIILRTILGLTPPEWAHLTSVETDTKVSQGYVRTLEKAVKASRNECLSSTPTRRERMEAMVQTAFTLFMEGAPDEDSISIHRMNKIDTKEGLISASTTARLHVPYSALLYERYLGRPFASHRDAVSELVGDVMENAIENLLSRHGITNQRVRSTERIPGFDQAPDFIIPSVANPVVIIEAKITEDDGTARDKVTRIQHLREMSNQSQEKYEVVACVDGRGFGIRKDDVRKMLEATQGKLFTGNTLKELVNHTKIADFITIP